MRSLLWYVLAALGEIGGCFAFWTWVRLGRGAVWALPGTLSLVLFALALTRVDAEAAGRAYAAYGGVYIVASLLWLWTVEGVRPDRWDLAGGTVCIIGTIIILFGPHTAVR